MAGRRNTEPAVAEISARTGRPCLNSTRPSSWLDVTADEFASNRRNHLRRLYQRYAQSHSSVL